MWTITSSSDNCVQFLHSLLICVIFLYFSVSDLDAALPSSKESQYIMKLNFLQGRSSSGKRYLVINFSLVVSPYDFTGGQSFSSTASKLLIFFCG